MSSFSDRHGYRLPDADITVRDDAPHELRGVVVDIAYESGLSPSPLRTLVCSRLRTRENSSNWSEFPNIDSEVRGLLDSCEWYEVYDIIEAISRRLSVRGEPDHFASELNAYFRRRGIGWQLVGGFIQTRGPESFERTVARAHAVLTESGRPTSGREIHEALRDLSRRPEPDITGSIQHSLAALECLARDITGDSSSTLGAILKRFPGLLPPPLDAAVEKLWGFASEKG